MNGTSGFQQDAQKGRPARPQQAKGRCVLCSVRGASERSENAAGGLFQHPARSAVFYLPPSTNRLLRKQRHRLGTDAWRLRRTHDFIVLSTGISAKQEKVPDTFSSPGFQEVRSSTSRSPSYRLLHEQRNRLGTGAWCLRRAKELPEMAPILPRDHYAGQIEL